MNKENSEFTVNTARDILKEMEISTVGDGKYIRKNISTEKVIFAMVEFSDRRNNTQSPLPESVEEIGKREATIGDEYFPEFHSGFIAGAQYHQTHNSAEVERLRKALLKIADKRDPKWYSEIQEIAKDALKEK